MIRRICQRLITHSSAFAKFYSIETKDILSPSTKTLSSWKERVRIKNIMNNPEEYINKIIYVAGWARTLRFTKKITFVTLSDGSTPHNIQIVIENDTANYKELEKMRAGCSLGFKGKIVKSPGMNQSIEMLIKNNPESLIKIYGDCPADKYPLAKKEHSLEFLREVAHLRPRTQLIGAVTRIRNALAIATHTYFQSKGLLYIHTPIITGFDCEGAGEMFQVTTLLSQGLRLDKKGNIDYSEDFFKRPTYLSVSGQLEAEAYACGLCDVYTFGPTFRAEKSHTQRHLAEFWMIEPEYAFADVHDLNDSAEEYLKYCISYVMKNNSDDLKFFNDKIENKLIDRLNNIVESTFERITYTDAINTIMNAKTEFEHRIQWGIDLFFEHEKYLAEKVCKKPIIIRDYPKDIKAFYMRLNEDNKTVAGIDVIVPKIGEIIGGSQREERLEVLDQRIKEKNLNSANYSWYQDLRKYGTVPHSGFGVGFERLIMMITGVENIKDVIPFPRTLNHAEF